MEQMVELRISAQATRGASFPIMSQIAPPVLVDLLARLKHPDHTGQP
jgi:hypothetical protein